MKIEQEYIKEIKTKFETVQSKKDLVQLLNYAKSLLYGKKYRSIPLKLVTYYANPKICKKRYQTFTIKKKSGTERIIHAPVKSLKSILRCLNFVLQCIYQPHKTVTGFVPNKSIIDNAQKHVDHHYVYNIDLKDFFHSFGRNQVKMGFMYAPFSLNGDKEPLAFLLASLCTHPIEIEGKVKTVLPQGSPTSPTISNILCQQLDRRLNGLGKRFGTTYTRYADDITFSSPHNVYKNEVFQKELKRIIEEDQQLLINPAKTRLQKSNYRQEVTGLVVNEKVNVRRRYIKQMRMWLYYWERYGYEKAEEIFRRDYAKDKGHVRKGEANLEQVLDGKLDFLRMVKGEQNTSYLKLSTRFQDLLSIKNPSKLILNESKIKSNNKQIKAKSVISKRRPLHRPQETYKLLSNFSSIDGGIKNLTHAFNYGFIDYDQFISQCKKEFEDGKKSFPNVPDALLKRIEEFAFSKTPNWYIRKGKEKIYKKNGWSEPEFVEWYKEYQIHPAQHARYNQEMIIPFKTSIQIRADLGNLKALINELKTLVFGENPSINLRIKSSLSKAQFYTDVDNLGQAIFRIFTVIKHIADINFCDEVEIDYQINNDIKTLSISHLDSGATKSVYDKDFLGGDLKFIKNSLWGLCNYDIIAKFPEEGYFRKVILSDNSSEINNIYSIDKNSINGFTHVLKFY